MAARQVQGTRCRSNRLDEAQLASVVGLLPCVVMRSNRHAVSLACLHALIPRGLFNSLEPHIRFRRTRDSCMNATQPFGLIVAWFLFGMARIVFTSTMVERRIDHPDPSQAIAFTWAAAKQRVNAANYDPRGQRLLPWYRVVTTTYWAVVALACWSAVHYR